MMCARFVVLLVVLALAPSEAHKVTLSERANPIRKVVTMLQMMQNKVTAEGEKEKELYDKFMCYCKGNSGSLNQAIADGTAKIGELGSDVEEAAAAKAGLEAAVKEAQSDKAAAIAAVKSATAQREKENSAFAAYKGEADTYISAMGGAIAALEKGMAGSFLQTPAASTLRSLALSSRVHLSSFDSGRLVAFLSTGEDSAQIIGILKQLLETMSADLADATTTENKGISMYKELCAAKDKEVNSLTAAIEDKLGRSSQLGIQIVDMKEDRSDTENSLADDNKFLAELSKNCATKTTEQQERVATRTQELAAIGDTIKFLNDDDAQELFRKTLPAPSLVQVMETSKQIRGRALLFVQAALKRSARGDRATLELISLALGAKTANFDKVIKMIDEMVALLGREQGDDDNKREYCHVQIDVTEDNGKEAVYKIGNLGKAIDEMNNGIAALTGEIAALATGIKALDESVAEATETRKEEHSAFVELMASNSAAKQLIELAKNRMNKFYNPKLYKAPPKRQLTEEERIRLNNGGTLAPTAAPGGIAGSGVAVLAQVGAHHRKLAPPPPTFLAYQKKSDESGGVIAMMDLLVADLTKEMTEAKAEEKNAQEEYEQMMKDSAAKRASDSRSLEDKEMAKSTTEGDLAQAKVDKKDAVSEAMATSEYLSSLHAECDWLLKYFDIRKEARAGEVESLKTAKAVLSGADYSLLQIKGRSRS